jgi:antibiotic biosynthesis monooxygenase
LGIPYDSLGRDVAPAALGHCNWRCKIRQSTLLRDDFQKIFYVAIRFHPSNRPWCVRNRTRYAITSDESVISINLLKVKPGKPDALIALLKHTTDAVVRTLHGWKTTRLIAAKDGTGVVIDSEWQTPAAVEAMHA